MTSIDQRYRRLHEGDPASALAEARAARAAAGPGGPVVVSACLCGVACRFDGRDRRTEAVLARVAGREVLPLCPEVLGGLGVPRSPVRFAADGRVVDEAGGDSTAAMARGARRALALAEAAGAREALLKERSPSCGLRQVHGPAGGGLFAAALAARGVACSTEEDAERAAEAPHA